MKMHPALLSSNMEHWLSPPTFLELVVRALGGITMDPATNRASQVPANENCYVGETNGLLARWHGNIFCNPPYGTKIPLWCARMHQVMRQLKCADQLIGLLPSRTDTAWCQRHVLNSCDAFCFWSGRITFWRVWETDKLLKLTGPRPPAPFRQLEDGTWIGPDLDKNGKPSPAPFPSLIPYWGPDARRFGKIFQRHGTVIIAKGSTRGVFSR